MPGPVIRLFSPDPQVMRIGVPLFFVAAAFQLFDGLQTVATGALRGVGETRIPMISSFVAYWAAGLPLGYYFGFSRGLGALGVWLGLALSLLILGSALAVAWRMTVRRLLTQSDLVTAAPM
jgi:MATE family multidrug resistance protein